MKKPGYSFKLFSHIAVLSLTVLIAVAATFSWYPRTIINYNESGNVLSYTNSGHINGSGATIQTFAGTNNRGVITYDSSATATLVAEPDSTLYFKTVITDQSTNTHSSMVSLYLQKISFTQNMRDYIHIGITSPEKTYRLLETEDSRNYSATLEDNLSLPAGGTKEVYWFVYVDSDLTSAGELNLGTLNLVYN